MFSQLCRARPRTLWDKISLRQPPANERLQEASRLYQRGSEVEQVEDDSRCQLEHCTFCDFRVCCQVASIDWEGQQLTTDSQLQATENPAYGLSSKNRIETIDYESNDDAPSQVVASESMESAFHEVLPNKDTQPKESPVSSSVNHPSQPDPPPAGDNPPEKMNQFNNINSQNCSQVRAEPRPPHRNHERFIKPDSTEAKTHHDSWPNRGDIPDPCDKSNPSVIEHSSDKLPRDLHQTECKGNALDVSMLKSKRNMIDRTFPLSLMKPMATKKLEVAPQQGFKTDLSRQKPVQKTAREKLVVTQQVAPIPRKGVAEPPTPNSNPLSEITQIKTEESIQEWLARIGDTTACVEEEATPSRPTPAWDPSPKDADPSKSKGGQEKGGKSYQEQTEDMCPEMDTTSLLHNATKQSPANIPMVVMQCSRLHSHIGSKPPYHQSSLPMGTLVTALYQESDWLYVQTPHGVEGFIMASNCVPIGTINDPAHTSRRPWEPCDFPIEINIRKKCEYGRLQGAYIPAKLPTSNSKQATPYVSTVKMKTNFYSDRYFSHTFKSKDSIKTAKTVTDILRNSPETKVSNQ